MRDVERVAREREKRALEMQIDSLDRSKVRKIAALTDNPDEQRIQKVAAYCRVSTDDVDQDIWITLQIRRYKQKIIYTPSWKSVGTYIDDGSTGTTTVHTQGFRKLMIDALDGKIDKIITKSVSRFANNLMECFGWVELLQNFDPPISVFFEQENLDTLSRTDRITLFILAIVDQEENRYDHI